MKNPNLENVETKENEINESKGLKRITILIVFLIVLLLSLLISNIFLIVRVNNLEDDINELKETNTNIDITTLDYYKQNLIYDGAILTAFEDDYLIYFLQEDCSACEESNEYIASFIYYGYTGYIPLYFINPEDAPDLFYETFNVDRTPTLIRMNRDQVVERETGIDSVFEMLDNLVVEANGGN